MKKNNKGFTLAELLIVVAVIAVLAAIAIPNFTAQTKKANDGVDMAAIRSEYAIIMSDYITDGNNAKSVTGKNPITLRGDGKSNAWDNATIGGLQLIRNGYEAKATVYVKIDFKDGKANSISLTSTAPTT